MFPDTLSLTSKALKIYYIASTSSETISESRVVFVYECETEDLRWVASTLAVYVSVQLW